MLQKSSLDNYNPWTGGWSQQEMSLAELFYLFSVTHVKIARTVRSNENCSLQYYHLTRKCFEDLQNQSIEWYSRLNPSKPYPVTPICCSFPAYQQCMVATIARADTCNEADETTLIKNIHGIFNKPNNVNLICRAFHNDPEICRMAQKKASDEKEHHFNRFLAILILLGVVAILVAASLAAALFFWQHSIDLASNLRQATPPPYTPIPLQTLKA